MPTRQELEQELPYMIRALENFLQNKFGVRMGLTLFLFELNKEPSSVAYISNAQRADMIETIKEWIARQEVGMTTDPAGPLGRA